MTPRSHPAGIEATSAAASRQADVSGTVGVAVHLTGSDPQAQGAALTNTKNLVGGLTEAVPVEVVVLGPAVAMLSPDHLHANAVRALLDARVRISACNNSLRSLSLTPDDLQSGVAVVGSGVVRLVELQRDGWAYLRP